MIFRAILVFAFSFRVVSGMQLDRLPSLPFHSDASAVPIAIQYAPTSDVTSSPASQSQAPKHKKKDSRLKTLTGTIEWEYKPRDLDCDVPNCDHFALYDDATQTNFDIDNGRAALPFEGQKARVTGIVDVKKKTIHLVSIEAVK
jgi:hypothetical protein